MSESAVFTALGGALSVMAVANVKPNVGRSTIKRVYYNPPESIPPGDLPCVVMLKDPNATHSIAMDSIGGARHVYQIVVYLIVGLTVTPLPELHAMAQPWGEQVAIALNGARTLSGALLGAWGMGADTLASYTQANISFSENQNFHGLRFTLTMTELL